MIILESKIIMDSEDMGFHCPTGKYVDGYFLTIDDLKKLLDDYGRDKENDNMIGLDTLTIPYIEAWLKKHDRIVKK